MRTTLPTDCGNSPRITIVGEIVTHWANRDAAALDAWLTDDATWAVVGREPAGDDETASAACPNSTSAALEVRSIITHGRLASCDGFVDSEDGRTHFSHVFRFASTAKSARVTEARSYLVEHTD